ncbi:MAG TPA: AsmA-like C-terminal region-containing protein [Vicinamibacterales bacterium]|nr:AsmA-like C-terminal region-containing protein [Vicinamibacterales bacterium]
MRKWLVMALAVLLAGALAVYFAADRILASAAVRAQVEQQLTARLGQPVRIGSLRASLFPDVAVDLGDVTVGDPGAVHFARIKVLTGLRALFADTIEIREIAVSEGRPVGAQAGLTFDLSAAVLGDRLDVHSLLIKTPTSAITGRGVLESIANLDGTFDVSAERLDLNELFALGTALAPPSSGGGNPAQPSRSAPMHIVVKTTAARVRFAGHEFSNLSTAIDAAPSRYVLDRLTLGLFGGTFEGSIRADTRGAAPLLNLSGTLDDVDAAELLRLMGSAGGMTGRLDARVALTGAGADGATLMRSANGTIQATLVDGTMPHLDLVRTVVLAFGKPSGAAPQGSGTSFERLSGNFTLTRGTLRSDDLRFRARDFDASGRGSLAVESGAVDARVDVVLSRELTAQAGTDLRRYAQEDGRVVVPATVGGTLTRPTVFIDVAAATRRALTNELKRRATDFLGGLFKKKKKGGGPPAQR